MAKWNLMISFENIYFFNMAKRNPGISFENIYIFK